MAADDEHINEDAEHHPKGVEGELPTAPSEKQCVPIASEPTPLLMLGLNAARPLLAPKPTAVHRS
jgi:hypothetical protein